MSDDLRDILWATEQIRIMANRFQEKRLPLEAVGAIEGYCDRIDREAREMKNIINSDSGS